MNFMIVYWKVINVYENEKVEQGKVDWKYNVYVGGMVRLGQDDILEGGLNRPHWESEI